MTQRHTARAAAAHLGFGNERTRVRLGLRDSGVCLYLGDAGVSILDSGVRLSLHDAR